MKDLKLFDDSKYNIRTQVCRNIYKMCQEAQNRSKQQTKVIATKSIKNLIKN